MKRTFSKVIISTDDGMPTNYEIAFDEFMPAFRASVAKIMIKKYGISQQKVAEFLDVTQAAISKYASNKYSGRIKDIENGLSDDIAEDFVDSLVTKGEIDAQKIMCKACQKYHKFDCSIMIK
jgi:predicted transcriptional regulator